MCRAGASLLADVRTTRTWQACPLEGGRLLQAHVKALHNFVDPDNGEYNLRELYYEDDRKLLISLCRRCRSGSKLETYAPRQLPTPRTTPSLTHPGWPYHDRTHDRALLAEGEALALELLGERLHPWDFTVHVKLVKVVEAAAALGVDGKEEDAQRYREELCESLIASLNKDEETYHGDGLFGRLHDVLRQVGHYHDGSERGDYEYSHLANIKARFLQQRGMLKQVRIAVCSFATPRLLT